MFRNRKYGWHGNYRSWQDAQKVSTGYDNDEILRKVRESMLKVKKGEAAYERDSVIFDEIQYSWPLLAGLMFAAAKSGGKIRVLDFGGSLGSTYFQNKRFLDEFEEVSWCIIEQKKFVDVGRAEFQDERLKFFYDIKSCMETEKPNILILSSVLQYLEKPYETLEELLSYSFEFVIVDLTSVSLGEEILTIQNVNPRIYNAKYPCWILNYQKIKSCFDRHGYKLIEKFDALNGFKVVSKRKEIGKYIGEIRRKND